MFFVHIMYFTETEAMAGTFALGSRDASQPLQWTVTSLVKVVEY